MKNMTEETKKAIAVAIACGNDYFIADGIAYDGNEQEQREGYAEWLAHNDTVDAAEHWQEWLDAECMPLEYDENGDYIAMTDSEADEACADYIRESLWAFNANFLAGVTGIDSEVFEAIQANDRCESNNDALTRLIGDDMERLIEQAIAADGRGHFLSTYDGNETEINLYDVTGVNEYLYVYRVN